MTALTLALDFIAGLLLGAVFYGGLWWTVRRVSGGAGALCLVTSFLLRSLIVLAGFYAIARGTWHGAAACCVGFFGACIAGTRFTRLPPSASAPLAAGLGGDKALLGASRAP